MQMNEIADRTVERAPATQIERNRAREAPVRHYCSSVASVQDAGDGQDQGGLIFLSLYHSQIEIIQRTASSRLLARRKKRLAGNGEIVNSCTRPR